MSKTEIDAIRELLLSRPRPADTEGRRARLDAFGQQYAVAGDVRVNAADAGGVEAEWTETPDADQNRVLLFLHGGGYVAGSLASHRHMVSEAGRQCRARTLALHYRRAPEHAYPAALEDTVAGYRFLLGQGIRPENIAIAGESAGGGLIMGALLLLRDAGEPLPACAWLSCPWIDLTMSGATMASKAAADPMVSKPYLEGLAEQYLQGAAPDDPLVSPLFADLRGLPPLLIQVGSTETLLDDALRLASAAGAADVRVSVQIWPHMIHAWHLFHPVLEEGRAALGEVGAWVRLWCGG